MMYIVAGLGPAFLFIISPGASGTEAFYRRNRENKDCSRLTVHTSRRSLFVKLKSPCYLCGMNEVIALQPVSLQQWLEEGKKIQLLDVREQDEWDICHIAGSLHIPMNDILKDLDKINPGIPTVVICHHGVRSSIVADKLSVKGYDQLYNLTGGIDLWARQVDKEMNRY